MIRPATVQDIPAILSIWNPAIRDTLITFNAQEKSADDLRQTLTEKERGGHAFLIAETQDSGILGFATYGQFRAGVGYARAMEHTIMLRTDARGRGIGRALMGCIEDHARKGGAHVMLAGVSGGNPEGQRFHAAIGYDLVHVIPEVGWKFGRFWDLVLMQKFLT
jgi:L-amino acid N-acyltransferase